MRSVERDAAREAAAEHARALTRGSLPLRPGEHPSGNPLLSELFDAEATEAMHGTSYEEDKYMVRGGGAGGGGGGPRQAHPPPRRRPAAPLPRGPLYTGHPAQAPADAAGHGRPVARPRCVAARPRPRPSPPHSTPPRAADVARLLDENASLSAGDRAYMLSGYLDVTEKRSDRYQAVTEAEKKA